MVPLPTAPLGDLRHCLQASAVTENQASPQTARNAGRSSSAQQRSRRQFQGCCSRQPPQRAPPQPQQKPGGPAASDTLYRTTAAILALEPQIPGCSLPYTTVTHCSSVWDLLLRGVSYTSCRTLFRSQHSKRKCQPCCTRIKNSLSMVPKTVGSMDMAISAMEQGLLRICPLKAWLNAFHLHLKCDRHRRLTVSRTCSAALRWWRISAHLRTNGPERSSMHPANTVAPGLLGEGPVRESDSSPSGTLVTQENMVLVSMPALTRPALGDLASSGSPLSGRRHSLASRTCQIPVMGLTLKGTAGQP
ncbi:UNVERIFIED_CONTAM: hypothetical protein FKN15_075218 [Acipenser sinensis]